LRIGIRWFETEEEMDCVIDKTVNEVKKLRNLSPLYGMYKEGIDLKSFHDYYFDLVHI